MYDLELSKRLPEPPFICPSFSFTLWQKLIGPPDVREFFLLCVSLVGTLWVRVLRVSFCRTVYYVFVSLKAQKTGQVARKSRRYDPLHGQRWSRSCLLVGWRVKRSRIARLWKVCHRRELPFKQVAQPMCVDAGALNAGSVTVVL